jgi:hypothetical protein
MARLQTHATSDLAREMTSALSALWEGGRR